MFAYDIVRIHSLMVYTDLIEYNVDNNLRTPLLHCFPFSSKKQSGEIETTGQYMNNQTSSNLKFRQLLGKFFHSIIRINLRDTSGEKVPFVFVGFTRRVMMFGKASKNHF